MSTSTTSLLLIAYTFALIFAMMAGGVIGLLLWAERNKPSAIALGTGGAMIGFMTLAATLIDHLLA